MLRLVTGLCTLRQNKYINAESRYSGRTSEYSLQNASAVQLAVSQPICGAAVIYKPAHGPPILQFVPSTNNCRSEHIQRMLLRIWLSQQGSIKKKNMVLLLVKSLY